MEQPGVQQDLSAMLVPEVAAEPLHQNASPNSAVYCDIKGPCGEDG